MDIREGLADILFEDAMQEHQTFGVETRKKVWEKECESFRARADDLIAYLRSEGLVRKVEGKLPELDDEEKEMDIRCYTKRGLVSGNLDSMKGMLGLAEQQQTLHMLKAGYTLTTEDWE